MQPVRASTNPFTTLFRSNKGGSADAKRSELKGLLKAKIRGTGRGVNCSEQEKGDIDAIARQLERLNPTKDVLGPALSAEWLLEYTTSSSILGTSRPFFLRANGPIYQTIRAEKLEARNQETWPWFSAVEATLKPLSKNKVAVGSCRRRITSSVYFSFTLAHSRVVSALSPASPGPVPDILHRIYYPDQGAPERAGRARDHLPGRRSQDQPGRQGQSLCSVTLIAKLVISLCT